MSKKTILFICTHNASRSQIAEGLVNHYSKDFISFSAGTQKKRVHPIAIKVLKEINIDISNNKSKLIDTFLKTTFDYVITVCDDVKENCPYFPGALNFLHATIKDPSKILGENKENLEAFRTTIDDLKNWLTENLEIYFNDP